MLLRIAVHSLSLLKREMICIIHYFKHFKLYFEGISDILNFSFCQIAILIYLQFCEMFLMLNIVEYLVAFLFLIKFFVILN